MARPRVPARSRLGAALALLAAVAAGLVLLSGGERADPRTPPALAGLPPPFLGTAVLGDGGMTAAVDAYGDLVDLRARPGGRALIDNPAERQAAGSVAADTGIVPRVGIDGGPALPLWRAGSLRQRYLAGTGVLRTVVRFGAVRVTVTDAATGGALAREVAVAAPAGVRAEALLGVEVAAGVRCEQGGAGSRARVLDSSRQRGFARGAEPERAASSLHLVCTVSEEAAPEEAAEILARAAAADRRWLSRARSLGAAAPPWAEAMYRRSLLTLRALTDARSGASVAGARDGWAYVWPRDAATAALAFAAAGYRLEAQRSVRFLLGLELESAARFHGDGRPAPGRVAQGDAVGWVAAAARATGLIGSARHAARTLSAGRPPPWRDRADYWEGGPGDYLGNALSSLADVSEFVPPGRWENSETSGGGQAESGARDGVAAGVTGWGLVRRAGDPGSGLDSAAAWAVRPFSRPELYPLASETLLRLAARRTRFGITPGEGWEGGVDPWTAPTAWSAWSLAALGRAHAAAGRGALARRERRQALRLLADLRRAATPAGALPERVDARTGIPRSTTPLAWSHAFAILALRELWPAAARRG